MSYTILSAVTNNYDTICDCNDTDADKRILYTDCLSTAKYWEQRLLSPNHEFPFDDIFNIRWNPFDHTSTDYAVWVDGSVSVIGTLKPYIDEFERSGSDIALIRHPFRDNIFNEYVEWCLTRNYNKMHAFNWLKRMSENGWDPKNKGLYQVGVCFFKNNDAIKDFGRSVIDELHYFNGEHLERLDQTVVTYLLKTKFKDLKVFELCDSMYKTGPSLRIHWCHPRY